MIEEYLQLGNKDNFSLKEAAIIFDAGIQYFKDKGYKITPHIRKLQIENNFWIELTEDLKRERADVISYLKNTLYNIALNLPGKPFLKHPFENNGISGKITFNDTSYEIITANNIETIINKMANEDFTFTKGDKRKNRYESDRVMKVTYSKIDENMLFMTKVAFELQESEVEDDAYQIKIMIKTEYRQNHSKNLYEDLRKKLKTALKSKPKQKELKEG